MIARLLPLVVFAGLAIFLYRGLALDPTELPSPLVGKPAPAFDATLLESTVDADGKASFASADMRGKVWLLNVWASWCGPCVQEHPQIVAFADASDVPVIGLNYKDQPSDATAWLARYGDPFDQVVSDLEGVVGLDYGVYGVPETFVIDAEGQVRHKFVGPIDEAGLNDTLLPLVRELEADAKPGAAS